LRLETFHRRESNSAGMAAGDSCAQVPNFVCRKQVVTETCSETKRSLISGMPVALDSQRMPVALSRPTDKKAQALLERSQAT
jgi:hypothetical protein